MNCASANAWGPHVVYNYQYIITHRIHVCHIMVCHLPSTKTAVLLASIYHTYGSLRIHCISYIPHKFLIIHRIQQVMIFPSCRNHRIHQVMWTIPWVSSGKPRWPWPSSWSRTKRPWPWPRSRGTWKWWPYCWPPGSDLGSYQSKTDESEVVWWCWYILIYVDISFGII